MTTPTAEPVVNPPAPPPFTTTPAGNFTNPAFLLGLVPTISFVLTLFFHKDFGLSGNATQWSVLAAGIVAFGCYIARAVKHHANGKVLVAWLEYLASQTGVQTTVVKDNAGNEVTTSIPASAPVMVSDGGPDQPSGGVDPASLRTGMVATTRSRVAKKTASSGRRRGEGKTPR